MATVASVHQQVEEWAEEKQDVGERAENVGPVLVPEKEERDCRKQAKAQQPRNVKWLAAGIDVGFRLHVTASLG
jgi:hypothetical protein